MFVEGTEAGEGTGGGGWGVGERLLREGAAFFFFCVHQWKIIS